MVNFPKGHGKNNEVSLFIGFWGSLISLRYLTLLQAWHGVFLLKLQELQEIYRKNTGDFCEKTGDFIKIKEDSLISQNTGGNVDFTGVIGGYRRSCHACYYIPRGHVKNNEAPPKSVQSPWRISMLHWNTHDYEYIHVFSWEFPCIRAICSVQSGGSFFMFYDHFVTLWLHYFLHDP